MALLPRMPLSLLLAHALFASGALGRQQLFQRPGEGLKVGARNRFWKHHVEGETLIYDGVDHYANIVNCLNEKLSPEEREEMKTARGERQVVQQVGQDVEGHVVAVVFDNAITPVHVKAVQSLAACVRQFIPKLYESRSMYQEMNLEEDPGLGGNCPTHLAPLVAIFLPEVIQEQQRTLEAAYQAVGWEKLVQEDREDRLPRREAMPEPKDVGVRASEHLTYSDFPSLAEHTDGLTSYTMNFAFSGPEDYSGGEFFIIYGEGRKYTKKHLKPNKYGALVFLGGRYLHGVSEITGGHREMFSTEFWPYPDLPFGITLWTSIPENMEEYIMACNREEALGSTGPCQAAFPTMTGPGMDISEVRTYYNHTGNDKTDSDDDEEEEKRPGRIRPDYLQPIRFRDSKGKEYDLDDFQPENVQRDFMIPKKLEPGEMVPIRWRRNLRPVGGSEGESFVIGFPEELHKEFVHYVKKSGMMQVAQKMLYEEEPLEPGEHRIYTLDDGHKWGGMIQGDWDADMVWLDPADEECFESLLSVLRRGGFDLILDKVGKAFDLDGLMVQGVGAIFLSEYEESDNMHRDINGSKGSFYNVIVPVHIPKDDVAEFYVGDTLDNKGIMTLDPNVGVVLGGESPHGTGECNYRETEDFRLSFAIYVADINEDNVDLIASDSTSLWPTDGDTDFFRAQQGRLWSRNGDKSLKNDKGRQPLHIKDKHTDCPKWKDRCETDPQGVRLLCPKTCKLYLEDDVYYALLKGGAANPTCPSDVTEGGSDSAPSSVEEGGSDSGATMSNAEATS